MMSSDDNGTSTGLLSLLHQIRISKALPLVCSSQLVSENVVTNTSCVDHGVGRKKVLNTSMICKYNLEGIGINLLRHHAPRSEKHLQLHR